MPEFIRHFAEWQSFFLPFRRMAEVFPAILHVFLLNLQYCICDDPESFVRGGSTLTFFAFLVDEGR